jgi:Lysyl oxidase
MSDLKPVLVPLKGWFGSHASLSDFEYRQDTDGKPILIFSICIANTGRGPLHIILGEPQNDGGKIVAPAKQRIFSNDNRYSDKDVGVFERHEEPGHVHWHYEGLASMDLVNKDGQVVATSKKEGYCLADSFRYNSNLPNSPATQVFSPMACEQKTIVGLSIGWADHYDFNAEDQYVEIEKVPSGKYWLRLTVNETKLTCDITEPQSVEVNIDHENRMAWSEKDDK